MLESTYSLLKLSILGLVILSSSLAQSVTGSGSASGACTVSAVGIFFNASGTNTAANPLTPGNSSNTGSFTGLASGTIRNLPGTIVPGPLVMKNFATFATAAGTIVFDLQSVAPGVGSNAQCASTAVGEACTPTGSPLTLAQIAPNAVGIWVTLNGLAYLATTGSGSASTAASISIQTILDGTVPAVLAGIGSNEGLHNLPAQLVVITQ